MSTFLRQNLDPLTNLPPEEARRRFEAISKSDLSHVLPDTAKGQDIARRVIEHITGEKPLTYSPIFSTVEVTELDGFLTGLGAETVGSIGDASVVKDNGFESVVEVVETRGDLTDFERADPSLRRLALPAVRINFVALDSPA